MCFVQLENDGRFKIKYSVLTAWDEINVFIRFCSKSARQGLVQVLVTFAKRYGNVPNIFVPLHLRKICVIVIGGPCFDTEYTEVTTNKTPNKTLLLRPEATITY